MINWWAVGAFVFYFLFSAVCMITTSDRAAGARAMMVYGIAAILAALIGT